MSVPNPNRSRTHSAPRLVTTGALSGIIFAAIRAPAPWSQWQGRVFEIQDAGSRLALFIARCSRDILVEAPWSRASPGGAKVASGYMRITNVGPLPDRLIGGSAAVAGCSR